MLLKQLGVGNRVRIYAEIKLYQFQFIKMEEISVQKLLALTLFLNYPPIKYQNYNNQKLHKNKKPQPMADPLTKTEPQQQNQQKFYPDNPRYQNKHLIINTYRFGIALIVMQIFVCFLYGFVIDTPAREIKLYQQENDVNNKQRDQLFMRNILPVFVVIGTSFFVLVGFGLLFAYNKHLVFSALGFNLLITALTIQWYFLFNSFWSKCARAENTSFEESHSKIYLTNLEYLGKIVKQGSIIQYQSKRLRATLTQALKCSLANSITFSAILGRAGPLEAFIVALVGTIGYQLNSQLVVARIGIDYGHTYRVFLFGSVVGLITGWLLRSRHETKFDQLTKHHPNYTGNDFSIGFSLLGMVFIWIFFPIFMLDPPYQHASIQQHYGTISVAWITLFHSMAASTVTAVGLSTILHGKLRIRDFLFAPIAGGIAVASASPYIVQPVWAILIGTVSGAVQCLSNNYQKSHSKNSNIVNTFSFTLFGFNGIMGSIWASIFRAVIVSRPQQFLFLLEKLKPQGGQFLAALGTIGLGVSFGIIIGIVVLCVTRHRRMDYFRDFTYWTRNDWSNTTFQRTRQFFLYSQKNQQESQQLGLGNQQKLIHGSQNSFNKQSTDKYEQIAKLRKGNQQDWFQEHYRDENQLRVWVQIGEDIEKINESKKRGREQGIFICLD